MKYRSLRKDLSHRFLKRVCSDFHFDILLFFIKKENDIESN